MDKDTQLKLERGREHYANREYDKAEPYLLKVVETHSNFADVMNMLGVIYHDRGQVALAQEYFEKALRINSRYTEAALNLAVTYNEQGKYAEAKQIHEHASSLKSNATREIEPFARGKITNMHAELGQAYAELNMPAKAIEQYLEALSLSPDYADIRTRFGQLLRDAGRLEEALDQFQMVVRQHPQYVPAKISLGTTYYALGQKLEAQNQWKEASELEPDNRTAGMYVRMIEQMLAMEEAEAAGMHLEVEKPITQAPEDIAKDELDFSFDGQHSSVASPGARLSDEETDV